MDPLGSITSNASLVSILAKDAVTPSYGLLSAQLSLATPGIYNYSSTYVGISARGQLLSATVLFQNTLRPALTTDPAQDLQSLTLNAQMLVDSFNSLQRSVAEINNTNGLPATGISGSAHLIQPLNTQAQASYANGDSALTRLSQLGITFQLPTFPGAAASLSIDQEALQAAFASDPAGAASLLAQAASAFSEVASKYISQSGSQYASIDALLQSSSDYALLFTAPQQQTYTDLFSLLSTQPQGSTNWGRVYSAVNEYNLVAHLFA